MTFSELASRMALSLGIGLLIGLERGWHTRQARPGSRTAGVRTFAITGLLGGTVAALALGSDTALSIGGGILTGAAFLAYAGVITLFCREENRATNTFSATTTIAALLTFVLGAYALLGDVRVAAAVAVATAGLLIVREELHEWVAKITLAEIQSGLVLLAMTFIALPIVPDRSFAVLGGVNPRQVWIIAIVLASVSFAGYVAVKLAGERRGVLIAAAAGGLVSSTSVLLANARRAASGEGSPHLLAAGSALATAVCFLRVLAIVAVLKPSLLLLVAPALLAAATVAAGFAIATTRWRSDGNVTQRPVQFRNPFGFWSVMGMAVSMGVLIAVGSLLYERFGEFGTIAGAATMGLFDVDSMAVSMTRLARLTSDAHAVAYAILVGVASDNFTKVMLGTVIGRGRFAALIAIVALCWMVAGLVAVLLTLALAKP